jgi:predicted acetyltransferase
VEIRKLSAEDTLQRQQIDTLVFNLRRDFTAQPVQPDEYDEETASWWGAFEGAKLLAVIGDNHYKMRFDGHDALMSGIGGVGTLPEARRGGYVRHIFNTLLPDCYERGMIFSNLAPFSHSFYRKFGYEYCVPRRNISLGTYAFDEIRLPREKAGTFTHILPGDDTSALAEVHNAYIKDINHCIRRDFWSDNKAWKAFTASDPYKTGMFIYLWKNAQGEPKGYIKYKDIEGDDGHDMQVDELMWKDQEGLIGTLGLIQGLESQYKNFKWAAPAYFEPEDLFDDLWEIEQSITCRDMTRIINVQKALELMRVPEGSGSWVLEVEDSNLPQNNGKYLVEYAGGKSSVKKTNKEADISADITVLAQLITGFRTLDSVLLTRREGIEVAGNIDTLRKVWTLRPQQITEFF